MFHNVVSTDIQYLLQYVSHYLCLIKPTIKRLVTLIFKHFIATDTQKNFLQHESQQQQPKEASKTIKTKHCDKKCCNVGRNSKKRPMLGFPKINLIDFTKINRKRNMKMCMKTKLVDGGGDGGDYMPLLITSTDDLVLPLNAEESTTGNKKSSIFFTRRLNRETMAHFLDTLTRTFCLPLLG